MGHYDQFSESSVPVDFPLLVLIVRMVIVFLFTMFLLILMVILVLFLVMFVLAVLIGDLVVFSFLFVQALSLIFVLLLFFNKPLLGTHPLQPVAVTPGSRGFWGLRLGK